MAKQNQTIDESQYIKLKHMKSFTSLIRFGNEHNHSTGC